MKLSHQFLGGLTVLMLGMGVSVYVGARSDDGVIDSGPARGANVEEYVAERRTALADASGERLAAVSFTDYLDEDVAKATLTVRVRGWFVAAPGGEPEHTDDPATWAVERAAEARQAVTEFDAIIPTADDPDFVRQYQHDRDRELHVAETLDAGAPYIFGAVVDGNATLLRSLAKDPLVRLVDVVDGGKAGEASVTLRGLRPEETRVVGQPPQRP